jgi:hypothetical protein
LNWHGARISFLALFLLALLKVKTVNLSELCLGFGGKALPESSDKWLQHFFREFELDYTQLATFVVRQYRAITTRYDKLAESFLAGIHLAVIVIWLA